MSRAQSYLLHRKRLLWLYFGLHCSTYFPPWKFGMHKQPQSLAEARLPLTLSSSSVMLSGSAVEHAGTEGGPRRPRSDQDPAEGADHTLCFYFLIRGSSIRPRSSHSSCSGNLQSQQKRVALKAVVPDMLRSYVLSKAL